MDNWYVLRSKPHRENHVYAQLCTIGVETYYPSVRVQPVNPRSSKIRPYFPGYMFVYSNPDSDKLGLVQWLPGAVGLVQFGGTPATVPDAFIEQLRQRLEEISRVGGLRSNVMQPGERVQIVRGPLEGYEAIFDARLGGSERVRLLLDLVGRWVKVEVDVKAVASKRVSQF